MLNTEQQLRDAATELRRQLASVSIPPPPSHAERSRVAGALALATAVVVTGVGIWLYTAGDGSRPVAAGPEPDRPADITVLFPSEMGEVASGMFAVSELDTVVDQLSALSGIEAVSGWDAARQLTEFTIRYADTTGATARLTSDDLPSSVNVWLEADADANAVTEQLRALLPEALHIIVGDAYVLTDVPWWDWDVTISRYQMMVLGDNEVTTREYEVSVAAVVGCLGNAGIWVSDPVYDQGQLSYIYGGTETREEQDANEAVHEQCTTEFTDTIASAWYEANYSEEEAQATRDEIGACLRFKGYEVSEHPTTDEIGRVVFEEAWNESEEARSAALDCMQSF
jgi:hypothetical protein